MKTAYLLTLLSNTGVAFSSILIPLLSKELGLSFFQLGLVVMGYGLASALSYFIFGRFSDAIGRRTIFVKMGLLLCFPTFLSQVLIRGFGSMLLIRTLAGFCLGIGTFPLLAYLSGLPRYEARVWLFAGFTSLGWAVGYLGAGFLPSYGAAFFLSSLSFLLGFFFSLSLPEVRAERKNFSFLAVVRRNSKIYLHYLLRHTGAQCVWTVFPIYLVELGASRGWVGLLYALNCGLQFFIMAAFSRMREPPDDRMLVRAGLILSTVTFLAYSLATSYLHILPVQPVLAIAWSTLYVGSLLYLLRRNVEKATSTSLLGSTISVAGVIGPFLGGAVSEVFGLRAVMLTAFGLNLTATLLALGEKG
ncbi:MAG: MFS transporter [Candidatus Hadarchaeales archaeon]